MAKNSTDVSDTNLEEDIGNKMETEETNNEAGNGKEASSSACKHYKRLCLLKAKCCSKFYPCRFCHDDDSTHEMNRHKVDKIKCISCETVQKVSKNCVKCEICFGEYFCPVCRLYDKNNKQFHCDKCGICRVGPREEFFHCDRCNACLNKELEGKHKCVENMSMSSCPICREFLHTSRQGIHVPKCGHMIHQDCLKSCFQQGLYQCPTCKESLLDMSKIWEEMDNACASVQLPEELSNLKLNILCQDCHKECEQLFNTEGLKCIHCGGYNTTQT